MIIYIVDIDRVAALEAEGHAPIPGHRNRIVPFQRSLQCMQPKARQIHALNRMAAVKRRENVA